MWELCFDWILPENYKSIRGNSQTIWGVRLIHDCSRPDGTGVNDFVGHFEKQKKTVVSLPKPDFVFFLYLCCFTLHCFIFYSATVSRITWCIQPWCVYGVKHIKCWQGGREEAVLYMYGLWWVIGSGRGSYINSEINGWAIWSYL